MKIREVNCKRWLLGRKTAAITLYPFIFYNTKSYSFHNSYEKLRRHEWVHVDQVRESGWIKFYYTWLRYTWFHGYRENPFEVSARQRALAIRSTFK